MLPNHLISPQSHLEMKIVPQFLLMLMIISSNILFYGISCPKNKQNKKRTRRPPPLPHSSQHIFSFVPGKTEHRCRVYHSVHWIIPLSFCPLVLVQWLFFVREDLFAQCHWQLWSHSKTTQFVKQNVGVYHCFSLLLLLLFLPEGDTADAEIEYLSRRLGAVKGSRRLRLAQLRIVTNLHVLLSSKICFLYKYACPSTRTFSILSIHSVDSQNKTGEQ